MPTVQGTYKFKKVLTLPSKSIDQTVSFSTKSTVYYSATEGRTSYGRINVSSTTLGYSYQRSAGWKEAPVYYASSNSWYSLNTSVTDPYADASEVDFGSTPQTVSAEFFVWLIANTEQDVLVSYRGTLIAGAKGDQSITLDCAGSFMYDDITASEPLFPSSVKIKCILSIPAPSSLSL